MALTDASVQRVASGLNDGLQDGDLAIRVAAFADTPKAGRGTVHTVHGWDMSEFHVDL